MRLRLVPVALTAVGVALLAAVNVLAAHAAPSGPGGRPSPVDPFAAAAVAAGPAPDGSGAATWERQVAALAVQTRAESDEPSTPLASPAGSPSSDSGAIDARDDAVESVVNDVSQQLPRTLEAWVTATAVATGIPARAVRAYGNAALAVSDEDPACRLGWPTLAGIGAVESGHGTHGGAALGEDGRPTVPIVGPALDGSPGRAAIRAAADSAAWHGDLVWDHAVGPMQFIPSTWRTWGADGDGDGQSDPQDVDDAALAAARYLCAGSRDLSSWDGWHAAILSYNHSEDYVAQVYLRAKGYASAVG